MACRSLPMIKNKCCIISVFFICILNPLNWQRTNPQPELILIIQTSKRCRKRGPLCFYQAECHTSRKVTRPRLDLIDVQTNHRAKCNLKERRNVKQKMTSSARMQHEPWEKTLRVQEKKQGNLPLQMNWSWMSKYPEKAWKIAPYIALLSQVVVPRGQ